MNFTFDSIFGAKLQSKNGLVDTNEALSNIDIVAVYFSASWCSESRNLNPEIVEKYNQLLAAGKKVQFVFASSECQIEDFNEYYGTMPWLALPYAERDLKAKLNSKYKISGIPKIIKFDVETGECNDKGGVCSLFSPNFIDDFERPSEYYGDISETMNGLFGIVSFILIQDSCEENLQKVNSEKLLAFATSNDKSIVKKFFTSNGGENVDDAGYFKNEFHIKNYAQKHKHDLVKCTEENPGDMTSGYVKGWFCDVCRKNFPNNHENRWICSLAPTECTESCDYCDDCLKNNVVEASLIPSFMVIANVEEAKYFRPLEGRTEFNEANLQQFLTDFKEGKCVGKKQASA